MFEKILVCLDGSKLAEQILPYSVEQARRLGSKLVLLQAYVLPTGELLAAAHAGPSGGLDSMDREAPKLRADALQYLEEVARPIRAKGVDTICLALQGTAGGVIVGYAQNESVGLIALATHGRSGLGRSLFGSVADHVVREAGLPILLIKPKA